MDEVRGLREGPSITTLAFCVIVVAAAVLLTVYLVATNPTAGRPGR